MPAPSSACLFKSDSCSVLGCLLTVGKHLAEGGSEKRHLKMETWKILCYSREHSKQTTTKFKNLHHLLRGSVTIHPVCSNPSEHTHWSPDSIWLSFLSYSLNFWRATILSVDFQVQPPQTAQLPRVSNSSPGSMNHHLGPPCPSPHPSPGPAPSE